ncbi:nitronate monooxygenase [Paenarthrobacter sp. Z7-10]|uniref:nitronate monooxygenase n=1 Tax=Paenarthrobacter sp. Z7-10 TaxID=2787635 RepID=UPI0022A8F073|nr:nitronate monooxygenase [Paenarthrobacter sp. Z7-10]
MFTSPILVAPMAGGTSTPALVVAAAHAGAMGFLAAGYKSVETLAAQLAEVRAAEVPFGVNVFVPSALVPGGRTDPGALAAYRNELAAEADRYAIVLPPLTVEDDDDGWAAKVDLLTSDPVPFVSFTFGLAPAAVVRRIQRAGSRVLASVTSVDEALLAAETGVDALVVQHSNAGSHTAAFLPAPATGPGKAAPDAAALVAELRQCVDLPLIGAGGLGSGADIRAVLAAGADAVQLGTVFLRSVESGARQLHKDALADPQYTRTIVTRAFTGKPARALPNRFAREHTQTAPSGYPSIHRLTSPIRAAAAAQADAEGINLWAGTGWQQARSLPARQLVTDFLQGL